MLLPLDFFWIKAHESRVVVCSVVMKAAGWYWSRIATLARKCWPSNVWHFLSEDNLPSRQEVLIPITFRYFVWLFSTAQSIQSLAIKSTVTRFLFSIIMSTTIPSPNCKQKTIFFQQHSSSVMFYRVPESNNVTSQYFYFPPNFHHWIDLFFLQIQSMSLSLMFSSLADQIVCFDVLEEQLFFGCKLCEELLRLDCVLSMQWSWNFSSDFKKFYFSKEKKKTFVYVNVCECSVCGYGLYAHVVQRGQERVLGDLPYHSLHFSFEAKALSKPRDGVLSTRLV